MRIKYPIHSSIYVITFLFRHPNDALWYWSLVLTNPFTTLVQSKTMNGRIQSSYSVLKRLIFYYFLTDILECAGAQYLTTIPKKYSDHTVVISCIEDIAVCETSIKVNLPIVNAEFVLTGLLRQDIDIDKYPFWASGAWKLKEIA